MATAHDSEDHESCRIQVAGQIGEDALSLKSLDRLDKLAILAAIIMVMAGVFIVMHYSGPDNLPDSINGVSRQAVVIISPEFDHKLELAQTLLNSGNLTKARELIDGLLRDYPYDGRPYMLLGDLYVHQQQPILAMLEYRNGVDLNPDFLDKKAKKLFRGMQIKNILNEARPLISAGLREKPGDPQLKEQLEILYYMLRRVAGSCG